MTVYLYLFSQLLLTFGRISTLENYEYAMIVLYNILY